MYNTYTISTGYVSPFSTLKKLTFHQFPSPSGIISYCHSTSSGKFCHLRLLMNLP